MSCFLLKYMSYLKAFLGSFPHGMTSLGLIIHKNTLTELSNNKDKMVNLHVGIFGYSNQYLPQFSVSNLNFPCN